MSLDATEIRLTKYGKVTMLPTGEVYVEGFEGENCSCRDVATLALAWAVRRLATELTAQIEVPGGSGHVCCN